MRSSHPLPGSDVVVDGNRLHVACHGRPHDGMPLLLIHGLPTTSYLWRDVMRDLEHDVRTIAADLLGLGESERPPHGVDLAAQARTLLGLLDQLGVPEVAVAGHDIGGAVAVHLAALAPQRVLGISLIATPVHRSAWPTPPVRPLLAPGLGELYVGGLRRVPWLARQVLGRALGGGEPRSGLEAREVEHYLGPLRSAAGAAGLLRLVRAVDLAPVEAAWRRVVAAPPPALLLWGERDHLHSPAYGVQLAGELPGAAWVPVGDAGHLLPEERPERVAEELAGFVADL